MRRWARNALRSWSVAACASCRSTSASTSAQIRGWSLAPKLLLQRGARAEEEGVHRSVTEPEPFADLVFRVALQRPHDQCGALAGRERPQRVDGRRSRFRGLGARREHGLLEGLLPRSTHLRAEAATTDVPGDRQQPCPLVRRADAPNECAVCVQERRLSDVLGVVAAADSMERQREHIACVPPVEEIGRDPLRRAGSGYRHPVVIAKPRALVLAPTRDSRAADGGEDRPPPGRPSPGG